MKPSERAAEAIVFEHGRYETPGYMAKLAAIIADASKCDEAAELLENMQWQFDDRGPYRCDVCDGIREQGHKTDCRLAAYLAAVKGDKNETE